MGQQQLLLIILGVLIIGVAIAVGLHIMDAGSLTANRDTIINDINNIAVDAQKHYNKPLILGGGGGSFKGYKLPLNNSENGNGVFIIYTSESNINIIGKSTIYPEVEISLTLTLNNTNWEYGWDWKHEGI
jgi:hypothetical protein